MLSRELLIFKRMAIALSKRSSSSATEFGIRKNGDGNTSSATVATCTFISTPSSLISSSVAEMKLKTPVDAPCTIAQTRLPS